jgi:hypothetical protein
MNFKKLTNSSGTPDSDNKNTFSDWKRSPLLTQKFMQSLDNCSLPQFVNYFFEGIFRK